MSADESHSSSGNPGIGVSRIVSDSSTVLPGSALLWLLVALLPFLLPVVLYVVQSTVRILGGARPRAEQQVVDAILAARPGSAHGYDVIDHNSVNPEIGSEETGIRSLNGALCSGASSSIV